MRLRPSSSNSALSAGTVSGNGALVSTVLGAKVPCAWGFLGPSRALQLAVLAAAMVRVGRPKHASEDIGRAGAWLRHRVHRAALRGLVVRPNSPSSERKSGGGRP
jgi:hypothetical protein